MPQCLECLDCTGTSKEFKTLATHLKAHTMSVGEYREKFGDDADLGYLIGGAKPSLADEILEDVAEASTDATDPNEYVTAGLDAAETKFFQERYKYLMRIAEDDRALESQIRDIVMGEITLMRYQRELSKISNKPGTAKIRDASALQRLINDMRKRNLDDIRSLNLTREQRQNQKKALESTPSRLLSRYAQIIAGLSPEHLAREREDELEAASRFQQNLTALLQFLPSDIEVDNEDGTVE